MDDMRLELRISSELLAQVDKARGDVPRATWIKRVLEAKLEPRVRLSGTEGFPDGRRPPVSGRISVRDTWAR